MSIRQVVHLATAHVCEVMLGETCHSLLTWPTVKLSRIRRKHFQTGPRGHHKQTIKPLGPKVTVMVIGAREGALINTLAEG